MRGLTRTEIDRLHALELMRSGGSTGIRDVITKSVALCFSLIGNHPFVDGNKRIGFAAMKVFLARNDYLLEVDVVDAESMILRVAAGETSRDQLLAWVRERALALPSAE